MPVFTIDATNNITAFASLEEARAAKINAKYFGSAPELAKPWRDLDSRRGQSQLAPELKLSSSRAL